MNWSSVTRSTLKPTKIEFGDLHKKLKVNNQDRLKILKDNLYTCRTCGGTYRSYLMMDLIKAEKCYDTYCRACYNVTHLNTGMLDGIDLYHSTITQLDIIRKTVDYVINNNKLPLPIEIDPEIKCVPISLLEYINLLEHIDTKIFGNYKIFFNDKFGINFITQNYNCMGFIDEASFENSNNNTEIQIEDSELCQDDIDALNKKFRK